MKKSQKLSHEKVTDCVQSKWQKAVSKSASGCQEKVGHQTTTPSEDEELSMSSTILTADVLNELLTNSSFIECNEKAVKKVIRQTVDESTTKLETSLDEKEESLKALIEKNVSTLSDIQKTTR